MAVSATMMGGLLRGKRARERDFDPNVGGGVDRDKLPGGDFAGPDRSFPIKTPGDVSDAAASLGRTKHNKANVRAHIIAIAHRKGGAFVSELPASWRTKEALAEADRVREDWASFDAQNGAKHPAHGKVGKAATGNRRPNTSKDAPTKARKGLPTFTMGNGKAALANVTQESGRRQRHLEAFRTNTRLRESSLRALDDGPIAKVLVIREGPGNPDDKHFYTKAALEKSVEREMWEGKPCFIDHPTALEDKIIPERMVEKQCGYFENARMTTVTDDKTGQRVAAIVADLRPEIGAELTLRKLRTAAVYSEQFPGRAYVGFSINAEGVGGPETIGGKEWNRVDEITAVTSVDMVTKAGAGGKLLSLREAYRMAKKESGVQFTEAQSKAVREALKEAGVQLTKDQDAAVDAKLGVKDGSPIDKAVDAATGSSDFDQSSSDDEDEPTQESSREAGRDEDEDDDEESAREAVRKTREAEAKAKKAREAMPALDADDDEESAREAGSHDEEADEDVMMEVGLKEMTRKQLEAFASKSVREASAAKKTAREAVREATKVRESARKQTTKVANILRERDAREIVAELKVPKAHQPRVLREALRDGKDSEDMRELVKEYMELNVAPFTGGGGAVLRESGVPAGLALECVRTSW